MAKNEVNRGAFFAFHKGLPVGIAKSGMAKSRYYKSGGSLPVAHAVAKAIELFLEGKAFVGVTACGKFAAEVEETVGRKSIILYSPDSGEVRALEQTSTAVSAFSLNRAAHCGIAVILALFPILIESDEFREVLAGIQDVPGWDVSDAELQKNMQILSTHIYSRIMLLDEGEEGFIRLKFPNTGNIKEINRDADSLHAERIVWPMTSGEPSFFVKAYAEEAPSAIPIKREREEIVSEKEVMDIYSHLFTLEELSDEERNLVPRMPDYYIEPEEVREICLHIKATSEDQEPMRNILLRGPAGSGKSMDAQAIAARLNRPFVSLTCSANMELSDLLWQILPNVKEASLPELSFGDIMYDPEGSWEKLTGEAVDSVEPEEVFARLMSVKKAQNDKDFILMESDFVRAIRNGWVVELQEVDSITQPGVLTGLNKFLNMAEMRTEGMLMPDGSRLKRHPDSIVVMTTNVNYEGCRTLNQSVVDRMSLIYDVDIPGADELFKRTKARTGFEEDETLRKMVKVVEMIADYLKNQGIVSTCGPRALNDWARSVQITGNVVKSCISTVINKAADDPEDREALISGCLYAHFRP